MRMWIAQNKYKLMAAIIGLYLFADAGLHKGQARVLFPKSFPEHTVINSSPVNNNKILNRNKEWVQAINSIAAMNALSKETAGMECDVYFDIPKAIFDVHHDPGMSTGLALETLLQAYAEKKMTASLWLDFKNLSRENQQSALGELIRLRNKFSLAGKMLVESTEAALLSVYSDSGFYTSYYTPMFNPYLLNDDELKQRADSLAGIITQSKVDALSGYYFQYPFLRQYFPNYPVLTWAANDRLSLTSWLFKRKLAADDRVFIVLYPSH